MDIESVSPVAVRSIRQRDLLQCWIRLFASRGLPPRFDDYRPDRFNDELPDLVFYDVDFRDGDPRFRITHEGQRFRDVFGVSGLNQYLDEIKDFTFTAATRNLYSACALRQRPAYSITEVEDRAKTPVAWERLLLPFCEHERTTVLLASLKPVSTEGRFDSRELMARNQLERRYQVYAIVDQGLAATPPRQRDDIVES